MSCGQPVSVANHSENHHTEPRQEVSQLHKLAVILVFNIYDTPSVLATPHRLAIDGDTTFGTDDSERNDVLH